MYLMEMSRFHCYAREGQFDKIIYPSFIIINVRNKKQVSALQKNLKKNYKNCITY